MKSQTLQTNEKPLAAKTNKEPKAPLTVSWKDLPEWMQDNHYIHTGYRPESNSYRVSAASLAYLHNESVNIWTHLIGALSTAVAAALLYNSLRSRFPSATREDVVVFCCFFVGAFVCLGMSATYHAISNHSLVVAKFGNRLDYIGIIALIWGSFVPCIYYGFMTEPRLMRLYWTMITTIGAGTFIVIFHPKFRTPAWRPFRAFMFVATGVSAVVPVVHGLTIFGYTQLEDQMGLIYVVTQGVLYIVGAALYAARIPERFWPGKFDIWGSSHQIFHILILMAVAVHLTGLLKAFDYEHSFRAVLMSSYENARKLGGPS